MDLEIRGGWKAFVDGAWKKRALHLPNALGGSPFLSSSAIFRTLAAASETQRRQSGVNVRAYVERAVLSADMEARLPRPEDGSLDGYDARMARELAGREYGVVLNHAQAHDRGLFDRARAVLHGLHQHVGAPLQDEVVIFLSRYRSTPFGVHKDACDNFLFGVTGKKRMRVWPASVLPELPDPAPRSDYERAYPPAEVFELAEGDMLYIPAGHYHVGEADSGLAAHASLIVADGRSHVLDLLQKKCGELLRERLAGAELPTLFAEADQRLPPTLRAACRAYDGLGEALEGEMAWEWATRRSAAGFSPVPPCRDEIALEEETCLRADPRFPILWWSRGDEAFCAASGHVSTFPAHPAAFDLLERLNTGEAHRVGQLLDTHAKAITRDGVQFLADRDGILALLTTLYVMGAVDVVAE